MKIVQNSQFYKSLKVQTSKSDFYKAWREKRQNMQDIIWKIISFLQFNIIIQRLVHEINIKVLVLIVLHMNMMGALLKVMEGVKNIFCAVADLF